MRSAVRELCCLRLQVGARLVAFLVTAASASIVALHAGAVRVTAADHDTLMHAVTQPCAALTTLSLWAVQQPPAAGQRFVAVPAPGPHYSVHALTRLRHLSDLRLSSGGSGIEHTAPVLLSQETVADLASLAGLARLQFDPGMDVPLLGVCRLLAGLTALTHLSTHGPRRPDLQTDIAVTPAGALPLPVSHGHIPNRVHGAVLGLDIGDCRLGVDLLVRRGEQPRP